MGGLERDVVLEGERKTIDLGRQRAAHPVHFQEIAAHGRHRAFTQLDLQLLLRAVPEHAKFDGLIHLEFDYGLGESDGIGDELAIEGNDQIPFLDPGLGGGSVVDHHADKRAPNGFFARLGLHSEETDFSQRAAVHTHHADAQGLRRRAGDGQQGTACRSLIGAQIHRTELVGINVE